METEKNGKGTLNQRDKWRKKVVKRWVKEITQKYIYTVTLLCVINLYIFYIGILFYTLKTNIDRETKTQCE